MARPTFEGGTPNVQVQNLQPQRAARTEGGEVLGQESLCAEPKAAEGPGQECLCAEPRAASAVRGLGQECYAPGPGQGEHAGCEVVLVRLDVFQMGQR